MASKNTGFTLEEAQRRYRAYITAEEKVLLSQEYELENRKVTRADLKSIREGIKYWENKCDEIASNGATKKIKSFRIIAKND